MEKGKFLEDFVARIERQLAPAGITVETRKPEYDEGVQIGEFDVHISGRIGSTELRWLMVCRNRPSDGKASTEWVQQLDGKRRMFGYSNVIAVSTTGFSHGACVAAELRTVNDAASADVNDWFAAESITYLRDVHDRSRRVFFSAGFIYTPSRKLQLVSK